MNLRKLERSIIKHRCYKRDGSLKKFREEWYKHHYDNQYVSVEEDGSVTTVRKKAVKKKKRHFDGGKGMRALRTLLANAKKKSQAKEAEAIS